MQELGAQDKPTLQVFNKIDLLAEGAATPMPTGAIPVSALRDEGLDGLLQSIDAALVADPLIEAHFSIPQSEGRVLAALERGATLLNQTYEGNNVTLTAWGPTSLLGRYRRYQRNGDNRSDGNDCQRIRRKRRKQQYRPPEWGAEVNPLSRGLHDPERVSGGSASVRLPG